jgi:hypothetical protein
VNSTNSRVFFPFSRANADVFGVFKGEFDDFKAVVMDFKGVFVDFKGEFGD